MKVPTDPARGVFAALAITLRTHPLAAAFAPAWRFRSVSKAEGAERAKTRGDKSNSHTARRRRSRRPPAPSAGAAA